MKMRRLLSIILCLCMFVSLFSMTAMAEDEPPVFVPNGTGEGDNPDPLIPDNKDEPELPPAPGNGDEEGNGSDPYAPAPIADEPLVFNASLGSYSGVYDGSNHIDTHVSLFIVDGEGNDVKAQFEWNRPEMINAGCYDINISGKTGGSYEGRSVTLTYTVNPVSIAVSAVNASKIYGEEDPVLDFNVDAGYEDKIIGAPSRESGEDAGSYSIGPGSLAAVNDNYTLSFSPGTFTINAKSISPLAVVSPDTLSYTGSELCPPVTVYTDSSMSTELDPAEYTVSYSSNINVGTAGFTVNDAPGGNYSFASIPGSFSIVKADPEYSAPAAISGLKYNGSVQQLIVPGSVPAGCTMSYSNSQYGAYSTTVPKGQQLGSYDVWWKIEGGSNYNDVGPYKLSVSITKYSAGDRVADMIRDLSWLPGGQVDPGNEHQRTAVLKVWNAYNSLSYAEQQKVPAGLYNWLYNLVSNTDYAIISGNGSTWYKGKSSGISFTAIDPLGKFAGVRVDGQLIDSSNYYYSGEAETCTITLKPSYLTKLGFGQHSISICYWNGYAPGNFYIMEASGSPPTGDSANFPLWSSMMLVSALGLAAAAVFVFNRKKNEG